MSKPRHASHTFPAHGARLKAASADVLFEIGTEELPATHLAELFESGGENLFETRLRKILDEHRLSLEDCKVFATPRRLVFWLVGVPPTQTSRDQLTKLLSKEEAYLPDGRPNEKLLLILRKKGALLSETVISELNGKPYVFIKKAETELPTVQVLPDVFKTLLKTLPFPKKMKWGIRWEDGSDLVFPRPIRSLVCLYGEKPVLFDIGELSVSNRTVIFLKSERNSYPVNGIPSYFAFLKAQGIMLDQTERKKEMKAELETMASSLGGRLYDDPHLLNEVNYLVESPDFVSAPFDKEFLKLPLEVLTISMARKQRIFGVLNKKDEVVPYFLAVLDGKTPAADKKQISHNCESILQAKLKDSLFFYKEDTKVRLDQKRGDLAGLIFLKGAGSMLEKSDRLKRLSEKLKTEFCLPDAAQTALERAAYLCKSDLLTQMVGEFPELQGIMGRYYAKESGENDETALAIGDHYLPRTAQDRLPKTLAAGILSILDKCDLITACFGLGLEPSSSLDPYGLRRSGSAVIKIALKHQIHFSLRRLLEETKAELDPFILKGKGTELLPRLEAFFKDRFKAALLDYGHTREDLIDAVLASGSDRLYETMVKIHSLSTILEQASFIQAAKVVERTVNILKGNKESLPDRIDPSLFTEDLESQVWTEYERYQSSIAEAAQSGDYKFATSLYAKAFFDILGRFFEKVFVYAEDQNVRQNRLALLQKVKNLYTDRIADLSKVHLNPPA